MTDTKGMSAPERIWAHPTERGPISGEWKRGKWKGHDSGASGDIEYIRADTVAEMIQQAVDDATSLHIVISAIREATVGVKPMLSDLPAALLEWRQAAVQAEREACVKVCEGWGDENNITQAIAYAIRARGDA